MTRTQIGGKYHGTYTSSESRVVKFVCANFEVGKDRLPSFTGVSPRRIPFIHRQCLNLRFWFAGGYSSMQWDIFVFYQNLGMGFDGSAVALQLKKPNSNVQLSRDRIRERNGGTMHVFEVTRVVLRRVCNFVISIWCQLKLGHAAPLKILISVSSALQIASRICSCVRPNVWQIGLYFVGRGRGRFWVSECANAMPQPTSHPSC